MTRSPATSLARHRIAAAAAFAVAVLAMILPALAGPLSAVAAEVAPRPTSGEGVVLIDGGVTVTAGSTVTLSGMAYTPGATISVKYDDSNLLDSSTVVGDDGTFQLEVTVPSDATVGQHWLRVLGSNPASSQIAYHYVAETTGALSERGANGEGVTTLSEGVAYAAGSTVTLSGMAYTPGATISVKYDDSNLLDSSTVVGDDGTFQLEVTVPSDATVGQHWLRVLGSNPASSQIAYLYVEDATASAPSPTAPSAEPTVSQTTSAAPAAEDTDELPVVAVVVGAVVLALAFAAGVVVIRRRGASAQ